MTHPYEADPQSGAGNCTCGAAERHIRHPHKFVEAWIWSQRVGEFICTCGKPASHPIHGGKA